MMLHDTDLSLWGQEMEASVKVILILLNPRVYRLYLLGRIL
jgi:hypothetical protein